ncbi:MAG: Flp pilus assembly protein CpaB [Actinomycetota bacterium]
MSRRAWFALAGALVLALIGVILLVDAARSSRDDDLAASQTDIVVVATKAIEQGTPVANLAANVEERAVAARDRVDGAIRDLAELDPGSVAGTSLLPGEQLVASRFVSPRALGRARIPTGLQEVSVVLAPERVVGGAVVPGDRVGMVFSFEDGVEGSSRRSQLTLQKILVTAVQQTAADRAESGDGQAGGSDLPSSALTLTFAVTPSQATQIVYAAEFGTVWLTLQRGDTLLDAAAAVDPSSAFAPSVGTQ